MVALLAPTLLALILGLMLTGSLRGLVSEGIRGWPAILVAFATELLLYNRPLDSQPWAISFGPAIWLATRLILVGVLVHNAVGAPDMLRWPWLLAATGLAMNALVVALNGGHMPQSVEAATSVWGGVRTDPDRSGICYGGFHG